MGARLKEPFSFSVDSSTTGVPKYKMVGAMVTWPAVRAADTSVDGGAFMLPTIGRRHFGAGRTVRRQSWIAMDSQSMRVGTPDLAGLARLLADGTRASFCLALLDGRAWTAAELARHAGVAASTATGHLNLMVAGGLLAEERQGRHRYVRLAGSDTAELIENLA